MIIEFLFRILTYASLLSVIIPLALGIYNFRILNTPFRALFLYVITAASIEGINYYLAVNQRSNYLVYNIFTLCELSLLSLLYYYMFEQKRTRIVIILGYALCGFTALYFFVYRKGFTAPDHFVSALESGFFISLSYLFYFKMLKEVKVANVYNHSFFWINSALLFYFSTVLCLFLFNDFLTKLDAAHYKFFYSFNLIANIIANVFFAKGIWIVRQA